MTITTTRAGDALVLHVAGRLDAITSPEFEKTCLQCLSPSSRRMVLDLEGTEYISSAGLRAILMAGKKVQAGGGILGLTGLRDTVKGTLEMAGFCTLFPVYDSMEAALDAR